jgi:Amt family ammonium transporter
VEELTLAINTVWVAVAAILVLWMHAGFTVLEAGFTRAKNTTNILMKNSYTLAAGVIVYYLIGFGFMFGDSFNGLIGSSLFSLNGVEAVDTPVPGMVFWFFQAVFAATAATIVSGAVAERIHFGAYALMVIIISGLIYPIVGHWIWADGWLANLGFIDFAGSTVVHSVGGWFALVGAVMVGPRIGKYVNGKVQAIPGHNMPLGTLGVLILFMGWFGFNGGSTLAAVGEDVGLVIVNTLLAGAAGIIVAMLDSWRRYKKPDISLTLNGALAGLVGITAGAADVTPLGALVIGGLAGALLVWVVGFIDQKLKVDDPVGAISVHGVCGAFGTLMVGLFATDGGLFYGGGAAQLGIQATGVIAIATFTITGAFLTLKLISLVTDLRVGATEEHDGLDIHEHGTPAYSGLPVDPTTVALSGD